MSAIDLYSPAATSTAPLEKVFAITPDPTAELAYVTRAICVGVAGAVEVVMVDGTTAVVPALQPGVLYPIRVKQVVTAGTTATSIIGFV